MSMKLQWMVAHDKHGRRYAGQSTISSMTIKFN